MAIWDTPPPPPPEDRSTLMRTEIINNTPCSLLEINTGKKFWFVNSHIGQDHVVGTITSGQFFDSNVVDILKPYIKPDSVVLDVGSNYGQMAMAFAELAPEGTIHAFEVNPVIFECIKMTFKENGFTNIISHTDAVWKTDGETLFFPTKEYQPIINTPASWGVVSKEVEERGRMIRDSDPARQPLEVKTITIDSLNLERVDVMKFDIQGSDLYGMMGAMKTIERCKPYIIFEFDSYFLTIYPEQTLDAYFKFVDSIGYHVIAETASNYLIGPK